jgi:hypothetical protein
MSVGSYNGHNRFKRSCSKPLLLTRLASNTRRRKDFDFARGMLFAPYLMRRWVSPEPCVGRPFTGSTRSFAQSPSTPPNSLFNCKVLTLSFRFIHTLRINGRQVLKVYLQEGVLSTSLHELSKTGDGRPWLSVDGVLGKFRFLNAKYHSRPGRA